MSVLHITNGNEAARRLRDSGLEGEVLPWRDVLHEGPVPSGLSLEELSALRARFLSGCPWGRPYDDVLREFRDRDAGLKRYRRYEETVLWFEHDLYDQLQLLQLLSWFAMRRPLTAPLQLICIGSHPGIEDFRGLGQLSPEQLAGLYPDRVSVVDAQLDLAQEGWTALTSRTPQELQALARRRTRELPYLRAALERFLEEYPSTRHGLSRSERQILDAIHDGATRLGEVFRVSQIEREERPYLGDWGFLLHAAALAAGDPLLELEDGAGLDGEGWSPQREGFWDRRLRLTDAGARVISGQVDRSRFQRYDRWLGGVHLEGERVRWRWAHGTRTIVEQS